MLINLLIISLCSHSYALDYFESDINYFEAKEIEMKNDEKIKPPQINKKKNKEKFVWKKYLSPKNDEFFKEGNYIPPRPFMEVMREPNDRNIGNWIKMIETKNILARRMQARMEDYIIRKKMSKKVQIRLRQTVIMPVGISKENKRFSFRLYFDSKCPHCKNMIQTMRKLKRKGFYIEFKQLDGDYNFSRNLPFPVTRASKEEIQNKKIENVPTLFVWDSKKKVTYRMTGYLNEKDIFLRMSKAK